MRRTIAVLAVGVLLPGLSSASSTQPHEYREAIHAIGRDIEALRHDFPQLEDYSFDHHVHVDELTISYAYHTHKPAQTGGWTSGVPNPDADGLWLHIDVHDPASPTELHNQPLIAPMCLGNWRVSYLSLQGKETRSVDAAIWQILRKHGVGECGR